MRALGLGQGLRLPPLRPVVVAQVKAQVWAPGVRASCVLDSSSCRGGGQGVRSSSPAQFRFFSYTGLFFANRTNDSGLYQSVLKYTLYLVHTLLY